MTITRIPLRVDNARRWNSCRAPLDRSKWLAAASPSTPRYQHEACRETREARAFAPVLLAEIARVKAALHHH